MAVKSNLLNMALVLTLTCLVCSAVLGGAYVLTKEPIDAAAVAKTNKAIAAVLPDFDKAGDADTTTIKGVASPFVYYKAVKGDSLLVGYAIESAVSGFGGELKVLVGITVDGLVYNTDVLKNNETPGLGAKCAEAESPFRKQWQGLDPKAKKLSVRSDGGDIDAITASTITSRAYTLAVENAVKVFDSLKGQASEASSVSPDEATESNEGGQSNE